MLLDCLYILLSTCIVAKMTIRLIVMNILMDVEALIITNTLVTIRILIVLIYNIVIHFIDSTL